MPKNWEARERKQRKRKGQDMRVSNRSIFTVRDAQEKRLAPRKGDQPKKQEN